MLENLRKVFVRETRHFHCVARALLIARSYPALRACLFAVFLYALLLVSCSSLFVSCARLFVERGRRGVLIVLCVHAFDLMPRVIGVISWVFVNDNLGVRYLRKQGKFKIPRNIMRLFE